MTSTTSPSSGPVESVAPTTTSARVIADSISPYGDRLTTVEVTMHRFVLAELNTHRSHSRNSASSRAIPVGKQLARVTTNPAWPLEWPREKPGMQGGTHLDEDGDELADAQRLFADVHAYVTQRVGEYLEQHPEKPTRLHKSLINRLLEPFMWHTVIATATDAGWENLFSQRCSPLAQPEIRVAAECMQSAMGESSPTPFFRGEWHTPYITDAEHDELSLLDRLRISVARCARVSYLNHDGERDLALDVDLFRKLVSADPPHWSPLEHVATPDVKDSVANLPGGQQHIIDDGRAAAGNFDGWRQLRHQPVILTELAREEGQL